MKPPVKAVILAGGKGLRLRPITDYLPKPLVPIGGIPVIEWQIKYFKKFGISEFVICAGYRAEQIVSHLQSKKLGAEISFSIEKKSLGTGGAIKNAQKYLSDDEFYVINGDVLTTLDPTNLQPGKNSIAVIPLRTSFGIVHLDDGKVDQFEEKPEIRNYWMNAGIYRLQHDVIKQLPTVGNIEDTTFPKLAKAGELHAAKYPDTLWHSVDSHKDMDECTITIENVKFKSFLGV